MNMGATTIWERWNSVLPDGKVSGTGMNSLNHYAYGSVCEFLYRYGAGIAPMEPGFKRIAISPRPTGRMPYLHCTYNSVHGKIVSCWKIEKDGKIFIHVEIPFDTSAVLTLPDYMGPTLELEAGSYEYLYQPEKDYLHGYTMDTRLEELSADPDAMDILKRRLPRAAAIIEEGNLENLSLSMHELGSWTYLGCKRGAIEAAMEEISKLVTLK